MKYIGLVSLASCLLLASCGSSPAPLVSKPPVKAFHVQAFTFGDGILLKKFSFPAAVYTPTLEDEDAYYYSPPGGQVQVSDTGIKYTQTAGIYLEKETSKPAGIYVKSPIGRLVQIGKEDIPATPIK